MRTFVTPSRPGRVSLLLLALALAGGGLPLSLALGASPPPPEDAPIAAAAGIMDAYQRMDVLALASLLIDDFRFVSDDPERPDLASPGFSRADELAAAWNLCHGVERPGAGRLPAARAITIGVGSWSLESLSGPAGVVVALDVTLVVAFEDGSSIEAGPSCHVFEVVRGDLATLPGGGHGDAARFYVRRWSEHTRNDCDRPAAAVPWPSRSIGEPDVTASSLGCGIPLTDRGSSDAPRSSRAPAPLGR